MGGTVHRESGKDAHNTPAGGEVKDWGSGTAKKIKSGRGRPGVGFKKNQVVIDI